MTAKTSTLLRVLLVVGSVVFSLAVVETTLRIVSPSNPYSSRFPLYPYHERHILVTTDGVSRPVVQRMNRWGFRGDDPPSPGSSSLTVIAVGGSTTQCYYLNDDQTWPARLQALLRLRWPTLWVENAGLDGHSTVGHEQLLKEVLSKNPPRVLLFLVGINDLALDLSPRRSDYDKRGDWKWALMQHSRILQMLYHWKLIWVNHAYHVQNVSVSYHPVVLEKLIPPPVDWNVLIPHRAAYAERVKALIAMSRQMNSEPIFLTQPLLWDDTPFWRHVSANLYWAPDADRLSAATFSHLMALYNQTLIDTCRAEHVEVIDLAHLVPKTSANFLDMVHFSAAGAQVVAEAIAEAWRTHPPVAFENKVK